MEFKETVVQKLRDKFPSYKLEPVEYRDELTLIIERQNILEICRFLKTDSELEFLLCEDVTGIDWARRKNRYTVVYHIFSLKNKFRLRLKADLDESDLSIESVTPVWKTADWHEREAFDMYGIIFNNHPDLRRMYMPEDFEYFPLRKDFPLMGIPGSLPLPKK